MISVCRSYLSDVCFCVGVTSPSNIFTFSAPNSSSAICRSGSDDHSARRFSLLSKLCPHASRVSAPRSSARRIKTSRSGEPLLTVPLFVFFSCVCLQRGAGKRRVARGVRDPHVSGALGGGRRSVHRVGPFDDGTPSACRRRLA